MEGGRRPWARVKRKAAAKTVIGRRGLVPNVLTRRAQRPSPRRPCEQSRHPDIGTPRGARGQKPRDAAIPVQVPPAAIEPLRSAASPPPPPPPPPPPADPAPLP